MITQLPDSPQKKELVNVLEVRARFVRSGTTFAAWARKRGFNPVYAHMAIWGKRRGPIARRIIEALKADLELP